MRFVIAKNAGTAAFPVGGGAIGGLRAGGLQGSSYTVLFACVALRIGCRAAGPVLHGRENVATDVNKTQKQHPIRWECPCGPRAGQGHCAHLGPSFVKSNQFYWGCAFPFEKHLSVGLTGDQQWLKTFFFSYLGCSVPSVEFLLERIDGLHTKRGQGHHEIEGKVVRAVPRVGHAQKGTAAAHAFFETPGVGTGYIGTLHGGHELFCKAAFGAQEALLHLGENLLPQQNVALDGVVGPYDVPLPIHTVVSSKGCSSRCAGHQVSHSVLADSWVALYIVGLEPSHQLLGRKAVVDHLIVGGVLIGRHPKALCMDGAHVGDDIADDECPAFDFRVVQTSGAGTAYLPSLYVNSDDAKGVLGSSNPHEAAQKEGENRLHGLNVGAKQVQQNTGGA